jgi:hypothetical protein
MNTTTSTAFFETHFPVSRISIPGAVVGPSGDCDFDITVGLMTRFLPEYIAVQMATLYGAQFESAASRLDRTDMHVLALAGSHDVFRLADPSFDAADELCALLETRDAWDRIKQHQIAEALDLNKAIAGLAEKLCLLDADEAKALWAALAFGQAAPLSDVDRLAAPWWTAAFITGWGSRSHEA